MDTIYLQVKIHIYKKVIYHYHDGLYCINVIFFKIYIKFINIYIIAVYIYILTPITIERAIRVMKLKYRACPSPNVYYYSLLDYLTIHIHFRYVIK